MLSIFLDIYLPKDASQTLEKKGGKAGKVFLFVFCFVCFLAFKKIYTHFKQTEKGFTIISFLK